MDKNPKHPLKKKKVMPKVCATANHGSFFKEETLVRYKKCPAC